MRAAGTPIKAETVRKHLRICMRDDPIGFVQLRNLAAQIDAGTPDSGTAVQRDVAKIVQRRAIRALQTGQLEVTTRDGLAAQALIDRRADRQKDRAFMLNLARLISGAGRPAPRELIVGDVPRDPDSAA